MVEPTTEQVEPPKVHLAFDKNGQSRIFFDEKHEIPGMVVIAQADPNLFNFNSFDDIRKCGLKNDVLSMERIGINIRNKSIDLDPYKLDSYFRENECPDANSIKLLATTTDIMFEEKKLANAVIGMNSYSMIRIGDRNGFNLSTLVGCKYGLQSINKLEKNLTENMKDEEKEEIKKKFDIAGKEYDCLYNKQRDFTYDKYLLVLKTYPILCRFFDICKRFHVDFVCFLFYFLFFLVV